MASKNNLTPLEAGAAAPPFRLPRLDGGETALAEITREGPALLVFFKISCPVCQLALPFVQRLHRATALPIYGVSQNDARDTRDFASRYGLTFPMLLDLQSSGFAASNAYGLTNVPTLFLVENGAIVQTIHGWDKRRMSELASARGATMFQAGENVPEWKAG